MLLNLRRGSGPLYRRIYGALKSGIREGRFGPAARLRETFELLKRRLEDEPYLDYLGEGIFITGGCSQLNGIDNLAEDVFGLPARASHARTMSGLTSAFENPQFSAAIGLINPSILELHLVIIPNTPTRLTQSVIVSVARP